MIAMGNFDVTSLARHENPNFLPKMVRIRIRYLFYCSCMQIISDVSPTIILSQIVFDKDGERLRVVISQKVCTSSDCIKLLL
jgi:hypothetical protein